MLPWRGLNEIVRYVWEMTCPTLTPAEGENACPGNGSAPGEGPPCPSIIRVLRKAESWLRLVSFGIGLSFVIYNNSSNTVFSFSSFFFGLFCFWPRGLAGFRRITHVEMNCSIVGKT